jgi:putative Mn2+ efflux pump MntP
MDATTTLLIAIGLAIDSFTVSITNGFIMKHPTINNALKIAVSFGSFQAIMPVIGWLAGLSLRHFIEGADHWIAFGLLSTIGCKMIYESIKTRSKENEQEVNSLNIYILLILSIATSIDALAVGLSLSCLKVPIVTPVITIGIITFLLSFFGVFVGNRFGHFFGNKIEAIGGLILIGIGIKILIEHLA